MGSAECASVMKPVLIFALLCSFCFKHAGCLPVIGMEDMQKLEKAELYISSSFNDTNMMECALKLICKASGMNHSNFSFIVGFKEMVKIYNELEETNRAEFPFIQFVDDALKLPGRACEDNYDNCYYDGNEAEQFEQNVLENQGKSRYPRQAEGPYYPTNNTEVLNRTAELVEIKNSENNDESGFTSKIKGYFNLAKDSVFGFSTDVKDSFTDVGEKAKDNCDKIKEYTKFIGCPAGQIGCGVLGLFSGGVPGIGCSATLSAACAATHFGVECEEE